MERFLRHLFVVLAGVSIASCQVHERIVGGIPTTIEQYSWQVSISYLQIPACGGSIIAPQWILTAAHCFPPEHPWSDYDVTVGTTNLNPSDSGTQTSLIDTVYKYPSYNEDAFTGDIALVYLKKPPTFGPGVQAISLLDPSVQIPAGMTCYVTGWGNTANGVPLTGTKTLQAGTVQVISSRTCQCLHSINPSSDDITKIQADMICAGHTDGSVDACQGDSGGPLSCQINGNWYQAGVVSWGDKCGAQNRPGVYISPSAYIDWIKGYVTDIKVEYVTINQAPIPDDEQGCQAADGNYYPYPSRGTTFLVTFITLPLYWFSVYLLTDL